ncbi:Gfo/Idh/MocA family protein [Paenibacillus agaridevorans]|uniref:Gfo/Idh/MocA family protein n=1 Tax=Paenibacillus agaridevorans TaxID=171404 RepID=UPI001BE3E677|nr:Gfo/Idh/MocA family oxidoreductase [Paenibacillus agaridevorans]
MTIKKVKIGILGSGHILGAHAAGFARLRESCEVVVAARKESDHARIRSLLGDSVEIVSDYKQLLRRNDIDAVDIILPHNLHVEVTIEAAKNGKHVLVEKVMARNVEECDAMIQACSEAGVMLTVGHDRRYDPDWQALKTIVDSGELGEVLFWKLEHNQNVVFPENSWIRKKDAIGGGAIMSCLTHQIDCLRWYGGEIANVVSMSKVEPSRMEGEVIGAVLAKMNSGALALMSINWYTQSHDAPDGLWYEFTHVTGTKGEAYYMSSRGTYVKIHEEQRLFEYDLRGKGGFKKAEAETDGLTGHQRLIEEWVKSLHGQPANIITAGTDSRKTVEVAEAAYLSERDEKVIHLPLVN